jgi:hypothetical protein
MTFADRYSFVYCPERPLNHDSRYHPMKNDAVPTDNGTASFKVNFIHQGSHQVDSTAMTGADIFWSSRVWNLANIKSLSFVPDDDGDLVSPTATADTHLPLSVLMIAANDGIRQGLI